MLIRQNKRPIEEIKLGRGLFVFIRGNKTTQFFLKNLFNLYWKK
jgi:hypothetical protein